MQPNTEMKSRYSQSETTSQQKNQELRGAEKGGVGRIKENLGKENNEVGKKKRESQEGCPRKEKSSQGQRKSYTVRAPNSGLGKRKSRKEVGAGSALIKPAKLEFSDSE